MFGRKKSSGEQIARDPKVVGLDLMVDAENDWKKHKRLELEYVSQGVRIYPTPGQMEYFSTLPEEGSERQKYVSTIWEKLTKKP